MLRLCAQLLSLALLVSLAGCGATAPTVTSERLEDLETARSDFRGDRSGLLWLRQRTAIRLELPTGASDARARVDVTGVLTRLGSASPGGETLAIAAFAQGEPPQCTVRMRAPEEETEGRDPGTIPVDPAPASRVDPNQRAYRLPLPALTEGAMVEVHCWLQSEGPVASDAVWLAASGVPVAESIVELRVPEHARAALRVFGGPWRPLTIPQGDEHVLAVRATDLAPRETRSAFVRWALRGASPRGFDQRWIQTWADATTTEHRRLIGGQAQARAGLAMPYKSAATDTTEAAWGAFSWVRQRLQRDEAAREGVAAARGLGPPLETNQLTATDKVQLLKWILDERKVTARFALGRSTAHPAVDDDYPAVGLFGTPLLWVTVGDQSGWMDPSCSTCKLGQVRPQLVGGQAILLPASAEGPKPIADSPWPPPGQSSTSAAP